MEGFDDGDDEVAPFRLPPPPDDRLWRHPSELSALTLPRRGMARGSWPTALVSGLVGSVLTIGLLAAAGVLTDDGRTRDVLVTEKVQPARATTTNLPAGGVVGVAAAARPSIVRIDVAGPEPGNGSGVLFRSNGYLLTNAHVVKGASHLTAVLADGSRVDANLVGTDPETDIAVLKLDRSEPFPSAVLGSATALKVGELAVAIGSPLGLAGGSSVTTGVISALGRQVEADSGPPLLDMIQTDAAIAPGSSGGALLDGTGAVVGITTAVAVSNVGGSGVGFATPIDIARSVAEQIIAKGKAIHVWLGVQGSDLDDSLAAAKKLPGGALVERVVDGSPAAEAGLAERDIVVAVGRTTVTSMTGLVVALRERLPGDDVDVTYLRDGHLATAKVKLVERPENPG